MDTKPSYNAICQAVKILVPEITREAHRAICGYPNCMTATNRYWCETYNIKPWDDRDIYEQTRALLEAKDLIAKAAQRGVRCPRVLKRICDGSIDKPSTYQLALAGYRYHHTAMRQGYCPVAQIGSLEGYNGRFGHGVIRRLGKGGRSGDSTIYENISYWIKK